MKKFWKFPLIAGALALTSALSGCSNNATTTTTPAETAPAMNSASAAKGAAPGTPVMAGPFKITLALDATEPKVGDTPFKATVTRDGKPVTDAKVKLELSMPQMNMGGPDATLAHTGNGVYAGKLNLGMGGAYRTKINVSANGATGDAVYEFRAVQ